MGQPEPAVLWEPESRRGDVEYSEFGGGRPLDASFWADVHVGRMRLYQTDHSYRHLKAKMGRCMVLAVRKHDTQYDTALDCDRVRLVYLYSFHGLSLVSRIGCFYLCRINT